ncbi:MAG: alpha/beta hydrolase, partial [Actinomycetota bacterium]|nr:alpha/beta hydrolase [Actinomycetota bacterium]
PWTEWWDDEATAGLFPDAIVRRAVEAEQPRLPLSYFAASVPVRPGWDDKPGAYLAFGDTYAAEREQAAARGWPVRTLPGRHLQMLHDPAGVAAAIVELHAE